MADLREVTRTFVDLADTLVDEFDVIELLHVLVGRCVDLLGVDAAGVMLADNHGQLRLAASSSDRALLLELFELQNDDGPCPDAFRTGRQVSYVDVGNGPAPWPVFAALAKSEGFSAVYALPLPPLFPFFFSPLPLFPPPPVQVPPGFPRSPHAFSFCNGRSGSAARWGGGLRWGWSTRAAFERGWSSPRGWPPPPPPRFRPRPPVPPAPTGPAPRSGAASRRPAGGCPPPGSPGAPAPGQVRGSRAPLWAGERLAPVFAPRPRGAHLTRRFGSLRRAIFVPYLCQISRKTAAFRGHQGSSAVRLQDRDSGL